MKYQVQITDNGAVYRIVVWAIDAHGVQALADMVEYEHTSECHATDKNRARKAVNRHLNDNYGLTGNHAAKRLLWNGDRVTVIQGAPSHIIDQMHNALNGVDKKQAHAVAKALNVVLLTTLSPDEAIIHAVYTLWTSGYTVNQRNADMVTIRSIITY